MPPRSDANFVDLEIRIFPRQKSGYPVEITLGGEQEFQRGWLPLKTAEWKRGGDPAADGVQLFQALFGDPQLAAAWAETRGAAENRRVRLRIDPEAPELHVLPWELMIDDGAPPPGSPLAATPSTPFSRYLPVAMPWSGTVDERPVRVLVVISNPSDLKERYHAEPVNVDAERAALEECLAELSGLVQVDFLTTGATLEALEAKLLEKYHVLHFVGHGKYNKVTRQGALLLEDAAGRTRLVPDDLISGMLARLPERPRLVFLTACETAVRESGNAFLGMAPRLVQAGVPAVLAMQDLLSMDTGKLLSQAFYRRLSEHGQVDRALNEARGQLVTAERVDAHVPVLMMRLKSGALWSDESNALGRVLGKASSGAFWSTLVSLLKRDQVVPVLGSRVHGHWLPGPDEMAGILAEKYGFPFRAPDGSPVRDLARVGQYLATSSGADFLPMAYLDELRAILSARLPDDRRPALLPGTLSELVTASGWKELASADPNEVHSVMASLRQSLYLTTNPDNMLEEAITCAGAAPTRAQCLWKDGLGFLNTPLAEERYDYNAENPVVFHLLGTNEEPDSLVISEDQYFHYLYNIASVYDRIPGIIRGKLSTSAIMFVGFGLYDWEFRVVMHGLVKNLKNNFNIRHVAVQLAEEDAAGTNEEAVQDFLTQYFSEARINVYWGSTAQFVAELRDVWEKQR